MVMAKYYVNSQEQANGDHEVHIETCIRLPKPEHRVTLGEHYNCQSAVTLAKKFYYPKSDGCYYCCPDCHTS